MKKNLKALYKFIPKRSGGEIELSLTDAGFGKPYPELDKKMGDAAGETTNLEKDKEDITDKQDEKDSRELRRETLREQLKHHQDAIESIKSEIAALEKDKGEDESDVRTESEAAKTKKEWDKLDKKELKKDTKKEKVQHEKDAIEDDKSKTKKLEKGKPSAKKSAEKKALKRDEKFDKKSEKNYAQILMDAAERFGGKKRSALKDSDFLDPKRRSFPVMSAQDVKDAVSSWGRYKGSMTFDEFKAKLTRRAKKIGAESALPKSWTEKK